MIKLCSEDFVDHVSGRRGPGIWRVVLDWLEASFDDRTVDRHAVATTSDGRCIVWCTLRGKHVGRAFPWLDGRQPTGRTIRWAQVHIFGTDADRIVERWAVRDDLRVILIIDAPPT